MALLLKARLRLSPSLLLEDSPAFIRGVAQRLVDDVAHLDKEISALCKSVILFSEGELPSWFFGRILLSGFGL